MNKPNLIIIGRIERGNVSGPGAVIRVLLSGLDAIGVTYTFINTYGVSSLGLATIFFRLFFVKDTVINVHTFGYKMSYLVLILSKINKSNRYYMTVHGVNSYEYRINGMVKEAKKAERVEKKLFTNFPNIICVSGLLKEYVAREFKRRNDVFCIYNCINNSNKAIPRRNSGNIFLYTGGFSNRKNPFGAIKFFTDICLSRDADAKMIMCGNRLDISLYNRCRQYILSRGLQKSISILGEISRDKLNGLYSKATFIVAPSIFDTFNMSVLEAMSFGCIPIVSSNCGIKDVINDKNGYIIDKISKDENIYANIKDISKGAFDTALRLNHELMAQNYIRTMRV
ncbi:glycosyltransferase family 4 protein [Candidatus Saccharibacteria bacterium]|nr:glycosyltransferase family 4 protein [Candidatus Saccharibacteria bacterium]